MRVGDARGAGVVQGDGGVYGHRRGGRGGGRALHCVGRGPAWPRRLQAAGRAGGGRNTPGAEVNLANVLAAAAERAPQDVAIVFGDGQVTYEQLEGGANRAASALRNLGVRAGERVALW